MVNLALKNIFQKLHSKTTSINPDSVMDHLLSKNIISTDDYDRLRQVSLTKDRCRDLLSLLYRSAHPQAFIYLRLVLLVDYSWIVDEIDKQVPSLTSQLQQLRLNQPSNGQLCHISTLCLKNRPMLHLQITTTILNQYYRTTVQIILTKLLTSTLMR